MKMNQWESTAAAFSIFFSISSRSSCSRAFIRKALMLSARKSPPGGGVLVAAGEHARPSAATPSTGLTLVSDEVVVEGGGDMGMWDRKKAAMSGGEAEPTERGGETPSLGL